jgi:hypothetical protein
MPASDTMTEHLGNVAGWWGPRAGAAAPGSLKTACFLRIRLVLFIVLALSAGLFGQGNARLDPETLVSDNPDGGALRCEPSVAAAGDTILVTWNDSYGGRHGSPTGVAIAWALSRDRGRTYAFGGYLPRCEEGLAPSGADSTVLADGEGNFLLLLLSWQADDQILFLYEMEKGGLGTWILRGRFSRRKEKLELIDRPSMFLDARGVLWVSFTTRDENRQQVAVIRSLDRGRSWEEPVLASKGPETKVPSRLQVDGRLVTVAWVQSSATSTELWCSVSADGGRTFADAARLASGRPAGTIPGYVMGVSREAQAVYLPNLALRRSSRPPGLEVAIDLPAEHGYDVVHGVLPFDTLARLFPECQASFFPAAADVPQGMAVLAYVRRSGTPLTDVCLSLPTGDGRRTVLTLSSAKTDWARVDGDPEAAPVQRNFGDYISLAVAKGYLVAAWTDGRSGAPRIYSRVLRLPD